MAINNYNYSNTVRVQANTHSTSLYNPQKLNTRREYAKNESMKRAKMRHEAIKSENLKEPLIKCPICGIKLSLDTEECPNCCHKMKKRMDENKRTVLLLIIAVVIMLIPFFKQHKADEYSFEVDTDSFFSQIEEAFEDFWEDEFYY